MRLFLAYLGSILAVPLAAAIFYFGWIQDEVTPFEEWFDRFGMVPAMTAAGALYLTRLLAVPVALAAVLNRVSFWRGFLVTCVCLSILLISLSFSRLQTDPLQVLGAFLPLGLLYLLISRLLRCLLPDSYTPTQSPPTI